MAGLIFGQDKDHAFEGRGVPEARREVFDEAQLVRIEQLTRFCGVEWMEDYVDV